MLNLLKRPLTLFAGVGLLSGALLAGGCNPPKYIAYNSQFGDWTAQVPWGWEVYVDQQGEDFTNYTFVGPFDKAFFNGVPSLSVRWYRTNRSLSLRDGSYESYASADDYIRQTLAAVYGSDAKLVQPVHDIPVSGWGGRHFIVKSVAEVPESYTFGVSIQPGTNRHGVVRMHEYAIVPMDTGFYVLIYPATEQGYDHHNKKFNNLVHTFIVKTDGPGGENLR